MPANIVCLECRAVPIEKCIVYNDRAELTRVLKMTLEAGENEVHIKNLSQSIVSHSVRVDGRGNATVQEVRIQEGQVTTEDSPEVTEKREAVIRKQGEVDEMIDRAAILQGEISLLDKVIGERVCGVRPMEPGVEVDDKTFSNIRAFMEFRNKAVARIKSEARETELVKSGLMKKLQKLEGELKKLEKSENGGHSKTCVISLESKSGGEVELDFVYQVSNCSWKPIYDLKVTTTGKPMLKLTYSASVTQTTGEVWTDAPLVLSTAQPSVGGKLPVLGTLEATFNEYDPNYQLLAGVGGSMAADDEVLYGIPEEKKNMKPVVAKIKEKTLCTEFVIRRPATIESQSSHKVTIGIVDVSPQLVHECVPSKNLSVFLTASVVNSSQLPFLAGEASVYLNGSFVSKTRLESVSPNEKFSFPLGIDTSIRVEYGSAKKYTKKSGIFCKTVSSITEQKISVKNLKKEAVLLKVYDHIPRSNDERIKITLLDPKTAPPEETSDPVGDLPETPREGTKMTAHNNLEWTVKLAGGQIQDLTLKWTVEHPKGKKVHLIEK